MGKIQSSPLICVFIKKRCKRRGRSSVQSRSLAPAMKTFFKEYKDYIENLIGLLVIFGVIFVGFKYLSADEIVSWVERAGVWAPIFLILAKASTMVFAPLSGAPLYPISGALFGISLGSLYLILGDILGGTISFYLSRIFGQRAVEYFARGSVPIIDKIITFMETTKGFLITRILFVGFPEAVSYAAGLTRIRFLTFIIISVLVGIPPTIILASIGSWLSISQTPIVALILLVVSSIAAIIGGIFLFRIIEKNKI